MRSALVLLALPLFAPNNLAAVLKNQEGPERSPSVFGESHFIRGIAYSPVPRGGDARLKWPYGDYFAPGFTELWERDFPLLQAMGANTLRVYHWLRDQDHAPFLDTAHRFDLKARVARPPQTHTREPRAVSQKGNYHVRSPHSADDASGHRRAASMGHRKLHAAGQLPPAARRFMRLQGYSAVVEECMD
jgi:hypothetical protein